MSAPRYFIVFAGEDYGRKKSVWTNEKTIILGNFPLFIGGRNGDGCGLFDFLSFPRRVVACDLDRGRGLGRLFADYCNGVRVLRRFNRELDFVGKIRFPCGKG